MIKSYLRIILFFVILLNFGSVICQNNFPYPVIFVHGSASGDDTWEETFDYLRGHDNLGAINCFDIVLNADNDNTQASLTTDIKATDFIFQGYSINVGRRNYAADIADFVDGWTGSNLFAINFKEERFRGATGVFNDYFDQSNESAIYKQGKALKIMIQEVLNYTGKDKVILMAHSMGGLAVREYLQRTDPILGTHTNWVYPFDLQDGHRVARVTTYGTPHLGQNSAPDPTRSEVPSVTGQSESNRDMIWEYNGYTGGCQDPLLPNKGIYLFGGFEYCVSPTFFNATFPNVDVNCNGVETDEIIGVNKGFYSKDYNPNMPLPLNIKYTFITSLWGSFNGVSGDGLIDINRQSLRDVNGAYSPINLSDTILTDIYHTSQPKDFKGIIRGLDEPKQFDLAYEIDLNSPIIGYVTYQMNKIPIDEDTYRVKCTGGNIDITINNTNSSLDSLIIYDSLENIITHFVVTNTNSVYSTALIPSPYYFIKLKGTATPSSWENPYTIEVNCSQAQYGACGNPIFISCGIPFYGNTSDGTSIFDVYGCASQSERGREKLHQITISDSSNLLIELTDLSTDLDVHFLTACTVDSCKGRDDNTLMINDVVPGTYFIAVDGFGSMGQNQGTYTLEVTCTDNCSPSSIYSRDSICSGDSIVIGTSVYTTSGIYIDTLMSQNGCDSIVTIEVHIKSLPTFTSSNDKDTINVGETINFISTGSNGYVYSWNFGDGIFSTLPSVSHTYHSSGVFEAILTVVSPQGCISKDTTTIIVQGVSSLFEISNNDPFIIYPNPVSDILTIKSTSGILNSGELKMYDLKGMIHIKSKVSHSIELIDVSSLKKGAYFLEIIQSNSKSSFKIIKL